MKANRRLPCGQCEAGTYDPVPYFRGLAMFGKCQTAAEAIMQAPRCKSDREKICAGARDWIGSQDFPITDDAIRQMIKGVCD